MLERKEKIKNQLEFYFSHANYKTDTFLKAVCNKNDGWINASTILAFKRMQDLKTNEQEMAEAVKGSHLVEVKEEAIEKTKEVSETSKDEESKLSGDKQKLSNEATVEINDEKKLEEFKENSNVNNVKPSVVSDEKIEDEIKNKENNNNRVSSTQYYFKKILSDDYLTYLNDSELVDRILLIKGLPLSFTLDEAKNYLGKYFKFDVVRMRKDKNGVFKGSSFVYLDMHEDIEKVLAMKIPVFVEQKSLEDFSAEIKGSNVSVINASMKENDDLCRKQLEKITNQIEEIKEEVLDIEKNNNSEDIKMNQDEAETEKTSKNEETTVNKTEKTSTNTEKLDDSIKDLEANQIEILEDNSKENLSNLNDSSTKRKQENENIKRAKIEQPIENFLHIQMKNDYFNKKKIEKNNKKTESQKQEILQGFKGKFYSYEGPQLDIKAVKSIVDGAAFVDVKNSVIRFKNDQAFEEKEFKKDDVVVKVTKLNEDEVIKYSSNIKFTGFANKRKGKRN